MAFRLPREILREIFLELLDEDFPQDLHPCALVNREWCEVAIPILWLIPMNSPSWTWKSTLYLRTLLSTIGEESRTLLEKNTIDLSTSPAGTLFNYASYPRTLGVTNLLLSIDFYLFPNRQKPMKRDEKDMNQLRLMFKELCKLFIANCNISTIEIGESTGIYYSVIDEISLIPTFPGAKKSLERLTTLSYSNQYSSKITSMFESMSTFVMNLSSIHSYIMDSSQAMALAKLISTQRKLEHLSLALPTVTDKLIAGRNLSQERDCFVHIFGAVASQKYNLIVLELKNINFRFVPKNSLEGLASCSTLQILELIQCEGLETDQAKALSMSFPLLKNFVFKASPEIDEKYPDEFITEIFRTASNHLEEILLEDHTEHTITSITRYCRNVRKLFLESLEQEQILSIFSNCSQLKSISFDCGKGFDANDFLRKMALCVPKTLEAMEIHMFLRNPWLFTPESLKIFLESCKCSFKQLVIQHDLVVNRFYDDSTAPEDVEMTTMDEEHFNVIKRAGVNLLMTNNIALDPDKYPDYSGIITIPESTPASRRVFVSDFYLVYAY
ncbi:15336_t:CDS:2 [Acaulospora morrowiae]|uniref:15336_t:CDS:1 n=1 Tax=Acaulospora morrowiae TaxID=94023 RepID=A0A9N9GU63_9GLOM|nr:15336_t:CDS:2 [Acaulospora morrowiae]